MTPDWRERPTAGITGTRELTASLAPGRPGAADGGQAAVPGAAPNGWWVGPDDDPDRYELLGAGFSGGEGTTYQARYHGESGAPIAVAVKLLHRPASQAPSWPSREDQARWRDHLQIIQQVRNEHLVQVRAIFTGAPPHQRGTSASAGGTWPRTPYVVMEWITGTTLDQRVTAPAGRMNPRLGITWVGHLASAISALHSVTRTAGNPLVHRDIKPGNCIVTTDDRLVLIDIGTLRRASDQPDPLGMHSQFYAAPEVLANVWAPRDPASDLYSLGGVAYFCLTGSDPPPADAITEESIRSALAVPRYWRRRVARHLLLLLVADPAIRRQVRLTAWAQQLRRITRRRRWPWTLTAIPVTLAAALALVPPGQPTHSGRTLPTVPPAVQQLPGPRAQSLTAMRAFGETYQRFGFSVRGRTVRIDPPASFSYLWGGFLPGQNCAATVTFDMAAGRAAQLPDFGLAVAPRAQLIGDQPQGASVQYEYEARDIATTPGTYIRPATLPGGAWGIAVPPVRAPRITKRHHVVVYAEGQSMSIKVDGRQLASYTLPTVECGGVAIRAWGSSFTLTNLSVSGS